MDELLDRVVRIDQVRGCLLFDGAGRLVADRSNDCTAEMRAASRLLVDALARAGVDEARRTMGSLRLYARRVGEHVVAVVSSHEADEGTLRLQLNVLAIRLRTLDAQVHGKQGARRTSSFPPNALHALERELVAEVGPFGKLLLEGALKRFHVTKDTLTSQVARDVVSQLASEIPVASRRAWLSRGTAIVEATAVGLPQPAPPLVRADAAPHSAVVRRDVRRTA